jgi:hypothetical protein
VAIRKVNRKETREVYGYEKHEKQVLMSQKKDPIHKRFAMCYLFLRTNDGNFAEREVD